MKGAEAFIPGLQHLPEGARAFRPLKNDDTFHLGLLAPEHSD
jgi:hypothetical protein